MKNITYKTKTFRENEVNNIKLQLAIYNIIYTTINLNVLYIIYFKFKFRFKRSLNEFLNEV